MKTFPIMAGKTITEIPLDLIAPYESQAMRNHGGQSLNRLSERGGLSPEEAIAVLHNRAWKRDDKAEEKLALIVDAYAKCNQGKCGFCNGSSAIDSGGVNPDNSTINIPCPNCYGGHFRPCQWCGDTGRVDFIPDKK